MQAYEYDYCDIYESYGSSGVMLENNGLKMFKCDMCKGENIYKKMRMIHGLDAITAFRTNKFKRKCLLFHLLHPIHMFWKCRHHHRQRQKLKQRHNFHGGGFNFSLSWNGTYLHSIFYSNFLAK